VKHLLAEGDGEHRDKDSEPRGDAVSLGGANELNPSRHLNVGRNGNCRNDSGVAGRGIRRYRVT
jgi:hypothetical protein